MHGGDTFPFNFFVRGPKFKDSLQPLMCSKITIATGQHAALKLMHEHNYFTMPMRTIVCPYRLEPRHFFRGSSKLAWTDFSYIHLSRHSPSVAIYLIVWSISAPGTFRHFSLLSFIMPVNFWVGTYYVYLYFKLAHVSLLPIEY